MKTVSIENVEKQIGMVTDSLIQNKELEIRETESIKKLNLWIVGLSTGIEMFTLNKIAYSATSGFSTFLFVFAGLAFIHNAISGLYTYKMAVGINSLDMADQRRLNYQRMIMIASLNKDSDNKNLIFTDFQTGELTLKIKELDYFSSADQERKAVHSFAKTIHKFSEKGITTILITQSIATLLLFFLS